MEIPDSRWTEDRLAGLDPPLSWSPDPERALAQVYARRRAFRRRVAGVLCGAAAAAIACLIVMALSAPQACATPTSCAEHFWQKVFPKRPAPPGKPGIILLLGSVGQTSRCAAGLQTGPVPIRITHCAAGDVPFCRARSHFSTVPRSPSVISGEAFASIVRNQSTSCDSYGYPMFPPRCPGRPGSFEFTIRSPERSRNAKKGTLVLLPPTFAISSLPPGVFSDFFASASITSNRTTTKYFATIG